MGRSRHTIDEIQLTGNASRLSPAELAERAEEENAPLSIDERSEVTRLDALIADALAACSRGQSIRGRRNPAFGNLATLVKTRAILTRGRSSAPTAQEVLAECDRVLGKLQ
jgi:hypothetical protein